MNDILLLTKSYFHKAKSQTMTLVILIAIAVALLNTGLVLQMGINTFFGERAEELNAGHFSVVVGSAIADDQEIEQFLIDHDSVVEIEQREVLFSWGDLFIGDHRRGQGLIFETYDPTIRMNPPSLIGDYLPLEGDVIYVPHFLMVDNGFELGDSMELVFEEEEMWFIVGGSTEEIIWGALGNSGNRFYISNERFQELEAEFPDAIHPLLTARLERVEDSSLLFNDLDNAIFTLNEQEEGSMLLLAQTFEFARMTRTMLSTIIGISIVALAGVLLGISAIVVRFRINSNVEEQVRNLGIQKALGYKNKQIIGSILLQFGGITFVSGMFGVLLTGVIMPFVARVMEGQIGLMWQPGIDLLTGILTVSLTIGFILLLAYLSARRVKKLYPLTALRDGITTHSFKKNYFPLEKTKRSLTVVLSFKQMLQSKKQLLMVTLIVVGLTFSAVASLTIYYNMVVDNEAFGNTIGGMVADVGVAVEDSQYAEEVRERLIEMPEVESVFGLAPGGIRANVNDVNVSLMVVEDSDYLGSHMLVDGRFPIHANEIAISPVLANMEGFEIGEVVTINRNDEEAEFLVTGIVQAMRDGGFFTLLVGDGFRRVEPDYVFNYFRVNLETGIDAYEFIDLIEAREGDFIRTFNIRSEIEAQLSGMGAMLMPVAFGSVLISAMVIVLVLYMVIKTTITRRHKELGIQKALGFTSFQLMNQIALNLLPIIVIGTLIGAAAGYVGFNPIFVAMVASQGIGTADLPTPLLWVAVLAVGMVVLAYMVALLIARRIRKISAYQLVSQ